jgi:deoxyribonuclease (pyrimidine dimer)
MTRINSAIDPKNLTDQHLIAELRELPRIFTAVNKRIEKGKSFNDIPEQFTLGTGHTLFFYNKLNFLHQRHCLLRYEYQMRFGKDWKFRPDVNVIQCPFNNFHLPTQEEKQLLIDRISTRITESNQIPRYYGEKITKEKAIEILKGSFDSESKYLTLKTNFDEKTLNDFKDSWRNMICKCNIKIIDSSEIEQTKES